MASAAAACGSGDHIRRQCKRRLRSMRLSTASERRDSDVAYAVRGRPSLLPGGRWVNDEPCTPIQISWACMVQSLSHSPFGLFAHPNSITETLTGNQHRPGTIRHFALDGCRGCGMGMCWSPRGNCNIERRTKHMYSLRCRIRRGK